MKDSKSMKLIIAGGRDLKISLNFLKGILAAYELDYNKISEIVCGEATGVDTAGKRFGHRLNIPVKSFPYESDKGKAGGPIRNRKMAEYGDALLLIWNCHSRGSANMKSEAQKQGLPIWEVILTNPPSQKMLKEKELQIKKES